MAKLGKTRDNSDGLIQIPRKFWDLFEEGDIVWAEDGDNPITKMIIIEFDYDVSNGPHIYLGTEIGGGYDFIVCPSYSDDIIYLKPKSKTAKALQKRMKVRIAETKDMINTLEGDQDGEVG